VADRDPNLQSLVKLLEYSIKAVPGVRYALGILSVAIAILLVSSLFGNFTFAITITIASVSIMFILMVLLLLLATAVNLAPKTSEKPARLLIQFSSKPLILVLLLVLSILLSLYQIQPLSITSSILTPSPLLTIPTIPSSSIDEEINRLRDDLVELRGQWESIDDVGESMRLVVLDNAQSLAGKLENLAKDNLDLAQEIQTYQYTLYTYLIAADVQCQSVITARDYDRKAISAGEKVLDLIKEAKSQDNKDNYTKNLNKWLDEEQTEDRANYLLALSYAVSARLGDHGASNDVKRYLEPIDELFFRDEGYPENNPLLKPFFCNQSDPKCPKIEDTGFCPK
jgi:hypothetical protein